MKHSFFGSYSNVLLKPLSEDEINLLRVWRNNSTETKFLRQIGYIDEETQNKWFNSYLFDKDIVIFAIYETSNLNRMVGSVALYNFRKEVCEVGKIQIGDADAHGLGIGKKALVIAMKIGFNYFHLLKIDGIVHQENIAAHKNDIAVGFSVVGSKESLVGGFEDIIEIDLNSLKNNNDYYENIVVGDNYGL